MKYSILAENSPEVKAVLTEALKKASEIQQQMIHSHLHISLKESISSIVTEADTTCEKEIISIIRKRYPDHNILGEESGSSFKRSEFTWVIDPIDGTSNFAAHIPWYGVLIAVFKKDEVILGGACLPSQNLLYVAEKGKGTELNGMPLVLKSAELSTSLFAFSTDSGTDEQLHKRGVSWYSYLVKHARNIRSTNSLVDFMLTLEGKFGGCINLYTKIWDIAAPFILFTEAGGKMVTVFGNPVVFDLNDPGKNYSVIAGPNVLVDKVTKLLENIY